LPAPSRLFGSAALDAPAWWRVAGFGVALFLIVEIEKKILRRNHLLEADRRAA